MDRKFLRKSQRLVSDEDFRRVMGAKCFVAKGIMRLYTAVNTVGMPRLGISVSNSCGSAVRRNRLKRLGREVFRLHQHEIPAGYDYVLIFTQKVPKKRRQDVQSPTEAELLRYQDIESRFLRMVAILRQKSKPGPSE